MEKTDKHSKYYMKYRSPAAAAICIFIAVVTLDIGEAGSVSLSPIDVGLCINQPVEYQCVVNGTGLQALTWRVYDSGTRQIDSDTYTSNDLAIDTDTIGGVFTVEQLSQSPLISNISFTVQSSINGYTIICEDGNTLENENFTVKFRDNTDYVPIRIDAFTNSSVNISWTESSSPVCVTGYRYNISSSALEENIIMESTSNSVMVEGLVPSDDQYCVVVTAIHQYNFHIQSQKSCFIFNYPTSVVFKGIVVYENSTSVTVIWEKPSYKDTQPLLSPYQLTTPDLIGYTATLQGQEGVASYTSLHIPPLVTSYTFTGVPSGLNYTVIVSAINGVGSSYNSTTIVIPQQTMSTDRFTIAPSSSTFMPVASTPSVTQSSTLMTMTTDLTSPYSPVVTATTESISNTVDDDTVTAIAVGVVVLILSIVLVISIVSVIVLFLYYWWKNTNGLD